MLRLSKNGFIHQANNWFYKTLIRYWFRYFTSIYLLIKLLLFNISSYTYKVHLVYNHNYKFVLYLNKIILLYYFFLFSLALLFLYFKI
jgi:hypothetical protein